MESPMALENESTVINLCSLALGLKENHTEKVNKTFADGSTFNGEFSNGIANGKGTKTLTDGRILSGKWKDFDFVVGECRYPDGKVVSGSFVEDKLVKAASTELEGTGSKHDIPIGEKGKASFKLSEKYKDSETEIDEEKLAEVNEKIDKQKILKKKTVKLIKNTEFIKFPDGSSYDGEMKEMVPNGKGRFVYKDGAVYDGDWKDGKSEGFGVLRFSDSSEYSGYWANGKYHGEGTFKSYTGAVYVGEWKTGKYEGKGKFIWPDKSEYDGYWKNWKETGSGIFKGSDGTYYEGEWDKGVFHGKGKFKNLEGKILEGKFDNGRFWPN